MLAAAVIGAAATAIAPGAVATEGNLYPYGASIWAVGSPFSATVLPGPVWQVQVPALSPAAAGTYWEMNWGCPAVGSEIAAVQWSALRTQAPSSLALQVTGDRRLIWSEGDAAMPQSPQGGRSYDVRLGPGNCNVHLGLNQTEGRNQHARGYFVDNPRILVRDVAAPTVSIGPLASGWLTGAGSLQVSWTAADNFGTDGIGAQRIVIGGQARWSGSPGAGSHVVGVPLAGIPDGMHAVAVQVDGDGTGGASAGGAISLDSTAPTASGLTADLPGGPGAVSLAWTAEDNLSGVSGSRAEINSAADGGTGGTWETVASTQAGGRKSVALQGLGLADGLHAWRVWSTDIAGNSAPTIASGRITIDTTPPKVDVHSVPLGWVNRADVDMTATDNLQSTLGIGATEIDVNTAPDGGDAGEWLRRAASTAPAGRRVIPVDLTGLESGRHAVRILVRNGGPLGSALATEKRAVIKVDLLDPSISRATFSPGGSRPMTVGWVADDVHAGVATATVQWKDGGAWRTLASEKASDGAGSLVVDVSALPAGDRPMRLIIADGAGNTTARAGTAVIVGTGAGTTAADPLRRLRDAHLAVAVTGAHIDRRGPRAVLVRRIDAGGRVSITGRLLDRTGRGIVGTEIQIRDPRGRIIGRGLTRAGGGFAIEARPVGGGILRIGVAAGRLLLPRRASVDVRIDVRPAVGLSASSTAVIAGEQILFSGRLRPSPAQLGLGSRKGIVLEWLDPVRRIWRPVVNARIRGDGTFSIPWTFGLGGLTIPMRVVVPTEVGWPLLPVRSGVIRVRVR
jgi:hypothetical protein